MKYSYMKAVEATQGNRFRLEKRATLTVVDPRYRDEQISEKYNLYDKAKTTPWAQGLTTGIGTGVTAGIGGLLGGGAMFVASRGNPAAIMAGAYAGSFAPIVLAASMAKLHRPDTEDERVARLKKNKLKKALIPGYAIYDEIRTNMTARDAIMSRARRRDEALSTRDKES